MSEDLSQKILDGNQTVIDGPDQRDHEFPLGSLNFEEPLESLAEMDGIQSYTKNWDEWPDQGRTSACSFFALEHGLYTMRNRIYGITSHLSALGGYNAAREDLGKMDRDSGLTLRQAMRATRKTGLWDVNYWDPRSPSDMVPDIPANIRFVFPSPYWSMSGFVSKTSDHPDGKDYLARAIITQVNIEKLPVFIGLGLPEDDMRSSYVYRTGIRSSQPEISGSIKRYYHMEFVIGSTIIDGKIYIQTAGSWSRKAGSRGTFFNPIENILNPFYTIGAFTPKKSWV